MRILYTPASKGIRPPPVSRLYLSPQSLSRKGGILVGQIVNLRRIVNPPLSFPALNYNTLIMLHGRRFLSVSAWLVAAAVLVPVMLAQSQRPLNHGDKDSWRPIF